MARRVALITGITGQDGSYLAEHLLGLGYRVFGIVRRVALEDPEHRLRRLTPILGELELEAGSLESFASIHRVLRAVAPDECYHLAAQSFVSYSFEDEFSTLNTNINGTHFVLAALHDLVPRCRFYFAASSEMFGRVEEVPQNERTRFHPLGQREHLVPAGLPIVERLHRRRGRTEHRWTASELGTHHGDVPTVVADAIFLLERGIVLLVDDDEPETRQWREDGRARPDDDRHVAQRDAAPLVPAFAVTQATM